MAGSWRVTIIPALPEDRLTHYPVNARRGTGGQQAKACRSCKVSTPDSLWHQLMEAADNMEKLVIYKMKMMMWLPKREGVTWSIEQCLRSSQICLHRPSPVHTVDTEPEHKPQTHWYSIGFYRNRWFYQFRQRDLHRIQTLQRFLQYHIVQRILPLIYIFVLTVFSVGHRARD